MDLSSLFSQCRVYTAQRSTADLLPPKQPAVYAFYDLFRFAGTELADEVESFTVKHARKIRLDEGNFPDFINIKFRGNPSGFKGQGRKICAELDVAGSSDVARYLAFLSLVNEPLYVGKTTDLKTRFLAHHDKDFLYFMKDKYGRPPEEFLFFAFFCEEKYVRVVESILIQLVNPPFCDQKT
ncbi:MAG TPA: GIY-YIG nuclease family protein [Tepidisphaeraceae bacterium]|nr:GIY-YIG nuclease family protein [Tepidisphaeraceae bacterium]